MPLVFIYPLCKRFTYWPQLVLGIAFNWGMLMAWSDTTNTVPLAAVLMWMGAVTWQIGYDTIYAYTDMKDDEQLGLRSTALRFRDQGLVWLIGFYAVTVVLWTVPGIMLGFGWLYYVFMLAIAVHFYWQLSTFDIHNPGRSFALFRANIWTGSLLVAGSLGGTLL